MIDTLHIVYINLMGIKSMKISNSFFCADKI